MPPRRKPADDTEIIEGEAISEDSEPKQEGFTDRLKRSFRRDKSPKEPKAKEKAVPRGHPNEQEVGELVMLVNLPVAMLSPRDAFTPAETERLTKALSAYAQINDNARRWMYGVVQKSALIALLNVVTLVALPRLIRHGLLPRELGPYIAGLCDADQVADAVGFVPPENQYPPPPSNGYSPPPITPFPMAEGV